MSKHAIITGVSGQDGAYLARLLLKHGYSVTGVVRGSSKRKLPGLEALNIDEHVKIRSCNLADSNSVEKLLKEENASELYNLAAQSSVGLSFESPADTFSFNTQSVLHLLEYARVEQPELRIYQASSSEMYGRVKQLPVTEDTVVHPLSPYAVSKAAAYWMTVNYREAYGVRVSNGILFNHESPLRSEAFFIKKLIKGVVAIRNGEQNELRVGNLDVKRDFGYGPKYVEAMWLLLQQKDAKDTLICSGASYSLRDIATYVFDRMKVSMNYLVEDPKLFRPTDMPDLYGDNSLAKNALGWDYSMNFYQVLDILIEAEATAT